MPLLCECNMYTAPYTFVYVSFNWIMTFLMPWGVTINWSMSSNWNQKVHILCCETYQMNQLYVHLERKKLVEQFVTK